MGIFLIMGSASALASAKCKEVVGILEGHGLIVESCSAPASLKAQVADYTHALLIVDNSMPPMAETWGAYFKKSSKLVLVAMVKTTVPGGFQKLFKFQNEWLLDEPLLANEFAAWLKQTFPKIPEGYESVTAMGGDPELEDLLPSTSGYEKPEGESSIRIEAAEDDDLLSGFSVNLEVSDSQVGGAFEDILNDSIVDAPSAVFADESLGEVAEVEDIAGSLMSGSDEVLASIESSEGEGSLLAVSNSEMKDLSEAPALSSVEEIPEGDSDSQTSQVVKRYALLKEKENREKQKTIDILRSELEKAKTTLHNIQSEKRRTMLKVDDIEADRRALQETVDELRHKLTLIDAETSQKIKDYQTRLENSQFVSKRFEKKLEEFKLRVRLDIQKIRARERELENRLELQKRDAEALLSTKDSRLLNQKREIDKLQFEMEILKERLVEETERAEDRNEKLHRASQSLKMAQGMLSGIDEGVISTSERDSGDSSGGEAA